jgi:hypothetical protein
MDVTPGGSGRTSVALPSRWTVLSSRETPAAACHICFKVISSLVLLREKPALEWVMCSHGCAMGYLVDRETWPRDVDRSAREESVNVALIANAVLPTDEVVKAVGE